MRHLIAWAGLVAFWLVAEPSLSAWARAFAIAHSQSATPVTVDASPGEITATVNANDAAVMTVEQTDTTIGTFD